MMIDVRIILSENILPRVISRTGQRQSFRFMLIKFGIGHGRVIAHMLKKAVKIIAVVNQGTYIVCIGEAFDSGWMEN